MSIQRVKEQHKIVIFQVKSRRRGKTLNWSPTGEGCIVAERLPMSTLPTPRGCHQLMITPPGEESLATSLKRSQNADFLPCRGGLKRYYKVSLQPSPTPEVSVASTAQQWLQKTGEGIALPHSHLTSH